LAERSGGILAENPGRLPAGESLLSWSVPEHRLVPGPAAGPATPGHDSPDHSSPGHSFPGQTTDVADSWLVDDGLVRGLHHHAARFTESCRGQHGVATVATTEFLDAACAALPRTGRWFPRVEFEAGVGFRLRLRPAPPPSAGVVLGRADGPDRRTNPAVKGPDLPMLIGIRQRAARQGAGEALLVSGSGTVLEGALSAVLWWRGDVLCAPPPSLPVLPSVTRRLLLEIAGEIGNEVRFEECQTEDLDGAEVWTASALHGIRPVTSWSGEGLTAAPPRRAGGWQARLMDRAVPVDQAAETIRPGRKAARASYL
jgi:branched-subunit amino acid aminotransferase/4-amino-4-deoxychorismate lyase